MNLRFFLRLLSVCLLFLTSTSQAEPHNLPELGDGTSSIVSLQQEYQTGQSWLRSFRQRAPIQHDPLIYNYLNQLIQKLAIYSALQTKAFDLLVVDSEAFNAFAVPGNIIGINTGLFYYAETEDQLASVIAHELAHLSQRHYARSVGQRKSQSIATLAAFLGSLILLATADSEAGLAAITTTQAAALGSQLNYSRTQEQEADRIGMQILADAKMNPEAMAYMFQHILANTRYRSDIRDFEFLMTHPLAESRVSDAFNQARSYKKRVNQDSLEYHLIKARIRFLNTENYAELVQHFRDETSSSTYKQANHYGLSLALLANNEIEEASQLINKLYQNSPNNLAFILLKSDLLVKQRQLQEATLLLQQHLELSPGNYPLSMALSNLYNASKQHQSAANTLRDLVARKKYNMPDIWYQLAETEGLAGNIDRVHLARAEYFIQVGAFEKAIQHLQYALPFYEKDIQASTRIKLRIKDVEKLKQQQLF